MDHDALCDSLHRGGRLGGVMTPEDMAEMRAAAHRALAAAAAWMPVEATEEMVEAGNDQRQQNLATCEVWRAMLAAAPFAPPKRDGT